MKTVFIALFLFFSVFSIFSFGRKETSHPLDGSFSSENQIAGNTTNIRGRVQIFGSEPHTFVGIVDQNGSEYSIYPQSQEQVLRTLQGYLVDFTVMLLDEAQGYGSLFLRGGTVTVISWKVIE